MFCFTHKPCVSWAHGTSPMFLGMDIKTNHTVKSINAHFLSYPPKDRCLRDCTWPDVLRVTSVWASVCVKRHIGQREPVVVDWGSCSYVRWNVASVLWSRLVCSWQSRVKEITPGSVSAASVWIHSQCNIMKKDMLGLLLFKGILHLKPLGNKQQHTDCCIS